LALQDAIAQLPVAHVAVACARAQAAPQAPQLASVLRVASQPLPSVPSQFPYPPLQDPIAHEPVAHVAVAFTREQGVPHEPQFVTVVRGVSQPFELLPSQSP
jgi:hypothetical protein